jgi:hypothetical protein
MSRFLFLIPFLLCVQIVYGQDYHIGRFEAPYEWDRDDFLVIPNNDKGSWSYIQSRSHLVKSIPCTLFT